MASILSDRLAVWATNDSEKFLPFTLWLPTEAWTTVRWQFELTSPSGPNIRVRPAYRFSNLPTSSSALLSPTAFANGTSSLSTDEWTYAASYEAISGTSNSPVGAFVQFGFLVKLSTGSTLTYARLRFAADGRA